MANVNAPFGLRPVRHRSGTHYNGAARAYYIPSTYATALYVGDPVIKTGTSNTAAVSMPGAGSFGIGTLPEINKASAGDTNKITGVIVGFAPVTASSTTYNPASTERIAYVCDDPGVLFEIQASSSANIAATDIGTNANLTFSTAGSTVTGLSGAQLDTSSMTTTATYQLNIVSVANRADVEVGSQAYTKLLVRINNHTETVGAAGI